MKDINSCSHTIHDHFVSEVCDIIDDGPRQAYAAVGQAGILTYWRVGRRIVEEEQSGQTRAAYGTKLIQNLSEVLIPKYGTSYSKRNLEWSHVCRVLYGGRIYGIPSRLHIFRNRI